MLEILAVPGHRHAPAQLDDSLKRLSRRAADLAAEGKHRAAARIWEELIQLEPDHEGVASGLGAALLAAGENRKAVHALAKACRSHPHSALLLRLHAQALLRIGESAAAVGSLYIALELEPSSPAIHATLGTALDQQRLPAAALPHARLAFSAEPHVSNAALLAGILIDLGRPEEAMAVADSLDVNGPDRASKFVLKSLCLQLLDQNDEALWMARQAVAVAPDDPYARCGLGMGLLLRGQLTKEAWTLYDSRAALVGIREWPSPERRWTGGDIRGSTLLVHAEQGFGDTLQFARLLPLVADRGAKIILAVQPALRRLMQHVPGADLVVDGGSDAKLPEFDYYCPLLSLPGIVGTTIDTIPPPLQIAMPPTPERLGEELQVGLVWAGNGVFVDDARRSVKPALLAPLAEVRGVTFHSLQFGAKTLPFPAMRDTMQGVKDFSDTAARIAGLDLVIAVDTSVAHLAATMGKPVWLLARKNGCWRWLEGRTDSPWYPSVRLYRQPRLNDWPAVIGNVCRDLERVLAKFEELKAQAA